MDATLESHNQNPVDQGLVDKVEKYRLTIEALSKDASDVSSTSILSIQLLMKNVLTGLQMLADSVAGDYDSRARQDPKSQVTIPVTLISSVEESLAKTESASIKSRKNVLKALDIRAQIGSMERQIRDVQTQAGYDRTGLEHELRMQSQLVAQADADRAAVQKDLDRAKAKSDKAATAANWWDGNAFRPWWGVVLTDFNNFDDKPKNYERLLFALKLKEATDVEAEKLSRRQTQLTEAQNKFRKVQIHLSWIDVKIAHLTLIDGTAKKALQDCEKTITFCTQTEGVMAQCKSNMTMIRSKCMWLAELVTRDDYVQTKADYVGVLLDCIQFGILDSRLAATGKTILESLRAGDQTKLLQQKDFARKMLKINVVLTGFDSLGLPSIS